MKCGQPCPHEHLTRDWHPNPCQMPQGHEGSHVCSNVNPHTFEWPQHNRNDVAGEVIKEPPT
jgi:hypothetical protein